MHCRDAKDIESIKKKTLTLHAGLGPKIHFGILTIFTNNFQGFMWTAYLYNNYDKVFVSFIKKQQLEVQTRNQ